MFRRRGLLQSRVSLIPPGNLWASPIDFTHSSWTPTGSVIVPNSGIAPDGTYTATRLREDAGNTTHYVAQSVLPVSGVNYVLTLYVKSLGQSRYYAISGAGIAANSECPVFNPDNGTVDYGATSVNIIIGSGCTMTPIANGWYRCVARILASGTGTLVLCTTSPTTNNSLANNQGDGASGILIWGAHCRQA
jgi:hypothetical protein